MREEGSLARPAVPAAGPPRRAAPTKSSVW